MRRLILLLGFVVSTGTFAAPAMTQATQAAPPAATRPDEYVRTFFLTHAPAQEMQMVLVQMTATMPGPRPVITVVRNTNSLTIRGTQTAMQTAEEVIKQLDVAPRAQPVPGMAIPPDQTPPAQGQASVAPQQSRLPNLPQLPNTTNIQLELTITDTLNGTPTNKTVSMVILNGSSGMIRTAGATNDHHLNVDAMALAYQSGMIGVRLSFEFTPPPSGGVEGRQTVRAPRLNESLTVVVLDGKPLVVSQSADAASDRKVTASITAKVLKF